MGNGERRAHSAVVGLLLLAIRGVLLWIIVPAGIVVWPIVQVTVRPRTGVRKFLRWLDYAVMALLQKPIPHSLWPNPIPWVPYRDIESLQHKPKFLLGAV